MWDKIVIFCLLILNFCGGYTEVHGEGTESHREIILNF